MKTDHFVFFASYADALSILSDEDFGRAVRALCHFAFTGEEPEYRSLSDMIFVRMAMPIVARERGAQPGNRNAAKKKAVPGAADEDETDGLVSAGAGDDEVASEDVPPDKNKPGLIQPGGICSCDTQQDDVLTGEVLPGDPGFPFEEIPFLRSETGSGGKGRALLCAETAALPSFRQTPLYTAAGSDLAGAPPGK